MQVANDEEKFRVQGLFHAGVLVSDIEECMRLFRDTLGLEVVFEARNVVQTAKGLSGVDKQIMNVLMLRGKEGVDLEIHQYVDPPAKPCPALNHSDIGSMHFMLRVIGIEDVVKKVEELGYKMMTPVVAVTAIAGFKYAYFRGPDDMMVELQEGSYMVPADRRDLSRIRIELEVRLVIAHHRSYVYAD